jgi:hypothetical protein
MSPSLNYEIERLFWSKKLNSTGNRKTTARAQAGLPSPGKRDRNNARIVVRGTISSNKRIVNGAAVLVIISGEFNENILYQSNNAYR